MSGLVDVWIFAKPAEWDALYTITPGPDGDVSIPFSYTHANAVTGYWKTFPGGYEVYNVIGEPAEVQELLDELTDVAHVYSWLQGEAVDNLEAWPTDPTNVLAVMQDHEGGAPATLENPNWGHWFLGQTGRIFAGEFSTDFSGEYL